MDLSIDVQNLHEPLKFIKSRNESVGPESGTSKNSCDFDIIDVSQINFEDDECWLYKIPAQVEEPVENLQNWLHNESNETVDNYFPSPTFSQNVPQTNSQKNIDTRTFTRPKKRFTRPSIEKYNEEVYGNTNDIQNENINSTSSKRKSTGEDHFSHSTIQEVNETTITGNPLNFDLTQPTNSYYFEHVLAANATEVDSFQNMSPPSLVNSMCSSTFANLMESSFIKNDPVLREIRDMDFTESVLLQDSEPPMFQSITESCSSLNSDTPESFLKKVSYSGTFRKNVSDFSKSEHMERSNSSSGDMNITLERPIEPDIKIQNLEVEVRVESPEFNHEPNFNGTYRRSPKANHTFRKSDARNATQFLKSAFEKSSSDNLDQNDTITPTKEIDIKELDCKKSLSNTHTIISEDTVDDMKKQLSEAVQITDLNRLSYCLDDTTVHLESSYGENEMNRTMNMKRSSLGCSTGSADSLDRMSSSLSTSSRGSNKMLNMADVDAIVEMQERSLQQVMSTPKPNTGPKKLWENNFISPIVNDRLSDSDLSSNDEYKSVKSTFSKTSLDNYVTKPVKSMGYLGGNIDTKLKTNQRSTYTLAGQKPLQAIPNVVRGSYSNLRTVQSNIPGSQSNLYRPNNLARGPSSTSNLLSMGQKLKGSYTSLRPISANLPVAPPINSQCNTTLTIRKATNPNVTQNVVSRTKVVEVPPMPRGRALPGDNHFVKPQQPRASGLPRPTGIPRPASRIPGPRTNVRPSSSRSANGRTSKDGYQ